ncbi:SusC/RagA family TonB-linked outer membrane protein [Wocania ichthyoenteri]|uniref:SusC/RagA family TonB-linked outer membrane protein n=1 Tax=Wocania ichthyoenteri TaxID=1230531 RepID=UPI00138E4009|nr:SusC/RagA family TonB-linked outer membrane protein [Wocania ichthyoenteri]
MKNIFKISSKSIKYLMKLSLHLFVFFGLITSIFAHESIGQNIDDTYVNIKFKKEPIEQALQKIENTSGFRLIYNPKKFENSQNVTKSFTDSSVSSVLKFVLKFTNMTFEQVGTHIVIKEQINKKAENTSFFENRNDATGDLDAQIKSLTIKDLTDKNNYQLTIKGKVSTDDGLPLAGATVLEKGTSNGATTDFDGNYSITVSSDNAVLVFSYVGMISEEVVVTNRSEIDVVLKEDIAVLNEVVVTSFGRKEQKRSLGYAVQTIKGDVIEESQQPNVANTLQGQIAGVQVTSSGGTPGASSSILIRGGTSIDGNNQPLFVIDGLPIDNETLGEPIGASGQLARTVSNSNRALDINPSDIESISVLKGPAAAALYGIRASNGAIIITTKSGKSGVTKFNYSSTFETMSVNQVPDTQSAFQQGIGGVDTDTHLSWGPALSGTAYNNFDNFFTTGDLTTHNLSASGGSESATFYFSGSRTDQKGIIPNTDYDRTTVKIKGNTKVLKNLTIGGSANYTNSNSLKPLEGPGVLGGSGGVMIGLINWPKNDDVRNYLNADNSPRNFGSIDNPIWSARNNTNKDKLDRFIGLYNMSYDPFNWLNISYKYGLDFYNQHFEGLRTPGTTLTGNQDGGLFLSENSSKIKTSNLIFTLNKEIVDGLNSTLLLGNNVEWTNTSTTTLFGTDFNNSDFVGIRNTSNVLSDQFITRKRIVSAFGSLQFDYKRIAFLSFTGRNDWTSTLPRQNRSFFYPSVGASLVFSELLDLGEESLLSYGKIRGTWAEVGKDAPAHKLASSLENNPGTGGGFRTGFFGNNPFLKPETTASFEIGTDLRFFKNKLGVDFTYYNIESNDQITQPRVSQGAGFVFLLVNGGTVENEGYEIALNAVSIRNNNFSWNVNVNWSTNKSKLVSLPSELPLFVQSDAITVSGLAQGASFVGETFFGLEGSSWQRNDNGDLVIGADGYPIVLTNQNLNANREPDWIGGITNTFKYKDFGLSFLFDFRQGGDIFNGTEHELVKSGLSTKTIDRGATTVFDGVLADGSPNTQQVVLDQNYYQNIYARNAQNFIEDGSWVRLRYISLNYNLPESIISKLPIKSASLNLTGKNLLLFTDYSGSDPEVDSGGAGVRGTGSIGIDYAGTPTTKGVSLGINVSF